MHKVKSVNDSLHFSFLRYFHIVPHVHIIAPIHGALFKYFEVAFNLKICDTFVHRLNGKGDVFCCVSSLLGSVE